MLRLGATVLSMARPARTTRDATRKMKIAMTTMTTMMTITTSTIGIIVTAMATVITIRMIGGMIATTVIIVRVITLRVVAPVLSKL
jgi:hypothetical protein